MNRLVLFSMVAVALPMAGCQTQAQFLQSMEEQATQAALARGKFELNCPAATGSVLSREVVQPAIQGPYFAGPERAEYTVGVSGCGQRATYLVLCPQGGSGCFSAGSRNTIIQQ
jgi:hypothetical protein